MATLPDFSTGEIPDENKEDAPPSVSEDFDPEFPGSTEAAPFGFKPNGTPYKRRPNGAGPGTSVGAPKRVTGNSDTLAKEAAGLLSQVNLLLAMSLTAANLNETALAIAEGNQRFEQMAYESLRADPALCRKILSAGQTSGKAGLVMAYGMLAVGIVPAARGEIQARREARENESESGE